MTKENICHLHDTSLHSLNAMSATIPKSIHQQFSEMGKKRAAQMTREERVRGGKNSWKRRLEKAKEAEEKKGHAA